MNIHHTTILPNSNHAKPSSAFEREAREKKRELWGGKNRGADFHQGPCWRKEEVYSLDRTSFFEKIRSKVSSEREYVIEILKVRGFLFAETRDELVISDNSSEYDSCYLDDLLKKYHIGYVSDEKVIIENTDCTEFISTEFGGDYRRNYEAASYGWSCSWKFFKNRNHGHKIPALSLEPFIARYIKALSACCVLTYCSCDGDHPHRHISRMIISMEGVGSDEWHRILYNKCLRGRFHLRFMFRDGDVTIPFSDDTKFSTYYELNRAAEFLYTNRQALRDIKRRAMMDIPASRLRHHSSEEIGREFTAKALELLDRAMPYFVELS